MNEQLLDKLKNAVDIVPDKHDGSYELVRETVEAYASMDSLHDIDYNDLELLYYMAIGTWQINIDKKKKAVSKSHLPNDQKTRLISLLDKVQKNADIGAYENSNEKHSIGMFGTGFMSVVGAASIKLNEQQQVDEWNRQIRDFVSMLADIGRMTDDEEMFARANSVFSKGVRGIQAGTASEILHCFKPYTFPILNSVGVKGYVMLVESLEKPSELKSYINNCKKIKGFRDKELTIKNYRTFDRLFWEVADKINFEDIIKFLSNYGGSHFSKSMPDYSNISNLGKNACAGFNDFCETVFETVFSNETFDKSRKATWQNSGKIRKYLWRVFKYKEKSNLPYSIAVSLEKVQKEFKLIAKVELEKGRTQNELERFNSIAIGSEVVGNMKYLSYPEPVSNGEILNKPKEITKLKSHDSDRICPVFVISEPYVMRRTDEITNETVNAIKALTPLYDSLVNDDSLVNGNIPQKAEREENQAGDNKVQGAKPTAKNIIFYGPPGTGKTYNTVRKAVEIIEPDKGWDKEEYGKVKSRYDKLLNDGRINFVTFHQSYGYEEFVQGIKPVVNANGTIAYEVQDGIFKEFCERAKGPSLEETKDYGLNKAPVIWKVSLEGTGDNRTRDYCFKNNCIRVGFDSYGENIADDTDFTDGGKNVLNAFINDMRVGDIVLSCYTNTTIDGVGVVKGDYEWHDEFDRFKRLRKVEWIYKGRKDIVEMNRNKTMTLSTVYRLNNITLADVMEIVEGKDNEIKNTIVKTSAERGKYVFIIDEINRGNISKIFGELITLIEDNKREGAGEAMKVTLPYKNDGASVEFSVPDNVYIIGTMNTADRSIAAIDTALRRRFTFVEMMPDYNALINADESHVVVNGVDVVKMLEVMNKRITVLYDREHTIGHAYFMPLKDNPSAELLAEIFRDKIIPLLQEYFYEDYGKIRLVLGDNGKNEKAQFITRKDIVYDDLFGNADEYELGDRSNDYFINEDAFHNPQAYIGIYAAANDKSSEVNG